MIVMANAILIANVIVGKTFNEMHLILEKSPEYSIKQKNSIDVKII